MALGSLSSCETCGCSETSCATCKVRSVCSNCGACCCTSTHSIWRKARINRALGIEYLSAGWLTVEVVGSIGTGLLAGSFALLAFGGDSIVELLSTIVVFRHLREDVRGSGALAATTTKI